MHQRRHLGDGAAEIGNVKNAFPRLRKAKLFFAAEASNISDSVRSTQHHSQTFPVTSDRQAAVQTNKKTDRKIDR